MPAIVAIAIHLPLSGIAIFDRLMHQRRVVTALGAATRRSWAVGRD